MLALHIKIPRVEVTFHFRIFSLPASAFLPVAANYHPSFEALDGNVADVRGSLNAHFPCHLYCFMLVLGRQHPVLIAFLPLRHGILGMLFANLLRSTSSFDLQEVGVITFMAEKVVILLAIDVISVAIMSVFLAFLSY